MACVGSGVMGSSDGFESKKVGAPAGGTGPSRLATGEYSGATRDPAIEALSGLGEAAANLVEISGVIKWFNRLRGFGFLTCGEGTPDIFVHMETLRRFGMTELRPGQYVLVRFGPGSKGMMAAEIQPETGSPGLSSH